MRWLRCILVLAAFAQAQPISVEVDAASADDQVVFHSAGVQSIDPPSDRLVSLPAGTIVFAQPRLIGEFSISFYGAIDVPLEWSARGVGVRVRNQPRR